MVLDLVCTALYSDGQFHLFHLLSLLLYLNLFLLYSFVFKTFFPCLVVVPFISFSAPPPPIGLIKLLFLQSFWF